MDIPNMLLVGSTARNTGKTTFCVAFLNKWQDKFDIIGLKVTAIRKGKSACPHGNHECGVCASLVGNYEITEETNKSGEKDTQKLLAAGAKKVFWIRALTEYVQEALDVFMAQIAPGHMIVCESNALTAFITPGASVLMHRNDAMQIKPSAKLFMQNADFVCDISEPGNIETVLGKIEVSRAEGQISLACNSLFKNFSLVILAGGKSSRMGKDKSDLIYRWRSFLENIVMKGHASGFSEIIISGAEKEVFGAVNIMDEIEGRGPLSGLYSCLKHAKNPYCFIVTVDVPKIDFNELAKLAEFHLSGGNRATILTADGKLDPLIGVYNSDLSADIYEIIKDKPQRIIELFKTVTCEHYEFKGDMRHLDNINTPEDYEALR